MNKTLVTSVIAAAGLAISGFAFAGSATAYRAPAANQWYAGIGANYTAVLANTYSGTSDGTLAGGESYNLDTKNVGFNVFVGKRVSQTFAHEFGYTYIGKLTYTGNTMRANKIEVKSPFDFYFNTYMFTPVAYGFQAFAKGGVNYMRTSAWYSSSASAQATAHTDYFNAFALNAGLGLQYMNGNYGVRAAWNHYFPVAQHSETNFTTADTINLDVLYHFA